MVFESECLERFHQPGIPRAVLGTEPGESCPEVTRGGDGRAAEQPARQDAVGGYADAELGEQRKDPRLGAATDERVLDLQIDDGMHRVSATNGVRPYF